MIYVLGTEKRAGAGGWAAHRGHHTPMAPGTRLVSPPQAWLPCRMPHGLAPGAAPAGHRGMNREKGQGCASTILPLAKDPKQPQPSGGSPGQPRQERGRAGLRAGAGTEAFLCSCLSAPATPRGCWCPTLAALRQPPPPALPGAGPALRLAVPPASNPQRSLLSPPRVLREQRRGEEPPARPWGKRPRNQKLDRNKNETRKKKKKIVKKIVTKGKTTNSLAKYKDLESDGATTASLEHRGHGHAPPASSTTRLGALGAQRAGVRPSPCPGGEEEGWPGARTAQCSPHPRRGFGEGG